MKPDSHWKAPLLRPPLPSLRFYHTRNRVHFSRVTTPNAILDCIYKKNFLVAPDALIPSTTQAFIRKRPEYNVTYYSESVFASKWIELYNNGYCFWKVLATFSTQTIWKEYTFLEGQKSAFLCSYLGNNFLRFFYKLKELIKMYDIRTGYVRWLNI